MHLRRWNIKRLALVSVSLMFLYFLFSSGYHKYEIDCIIKNSNPEAVWEYVADFSKMRLLNPTIVDFQIISDGGNLHDWRYSVIYSEKLSHWPYWLNVAKADYVVKQSMPGVEPRFYTISSQHQTCFFKGIYCLHAFSEFKFSSMGKDTFCAEKIEYQCPPFLGSACRRELEYQRKAVMHNLTTIFSNKNLH